MHTAATIALARDDVEEAERYFCDALRAAPTSSLEVPFTLDGLGLVATRRGRHEHALRLFAMAQGIRGKRLHTEPAWRRQVDAAMAAVHQALDPVVAEQIVRAAEPIGRDNAISYALRQVGPGNQDQADLLDDAERAVALLVAAGHTNRTVAERLGISIRAVAYRLQGIRDKVGLGSRSDITKWARDHLGPG